MVSHVESFSYILSGYLLSSYIFSFEPKIEQESDPEPYAETKADLQELEPQSTSKHVMTINFSTDPELESLFELNN